MKDGKHVILYVDDDQDYLDTVRVILESGGFVMVEAHSAEEGLKTYKAVKPDLLLLDLMMEEVDSGTGMIKELRLLNNKAPVFIMSSAGDQLNMVTSYADLGLDGIFQKPVDPKVLLHTLKEKLVRAG
ncbi:MAG: response regulator [Lentisphaerae bacterium]|nr:response regulator [Lentisphaerota bacterium]